MSNNKVREAKQTRICAQILGTLGRMRSRSASTSHFSGERMILCRDNVVTDARFAGSRCGTVLDRKTLEDPVGHELELRGIPQIHRRPRPKQRPEDRMCLLRTGGMYCRATRHVVLLLKHLHAMSTRLPAHCQVPKQVPACMHVTA